MSFGPLTDEYLTSVLGAKCPNCGHRGGHHRKGNQWQEPCPDPVDVPPPPPLD